MKKIVVKYDNAVKMRGDFIADFFNSNLAPKGKHYEYRTGIGIVLVDNESGNWSAKICTTENDRHTDALILVAVIDSLYELGKI